MVHIHCQASIYTLSLCRRHSWRVRLAKQETLTPPGHLVSPLLCMGPWMSTVVFYCWYHSDGASVLLYFTFYWTLVHLKKTRYLRFTRKKWSVPHEKIICGDRLIIYIHMYIVNVLCSRKFKVADCSRRKAVLYPAFRRNVLWYDIHPGIRPTLRFSDSLSVC